MKSDIIKNIFITNFHHKKGCEIETIYPSNFEKSELNFWKYLPNLTLPDGAHHYSKGFLYFTLPNDIFDDSMLYGISCYKQVKSKDILNKSKEVTRSTVQKSLCILTTLPLFTYLKHKMYDALDCYFDLKDITQIEFLTNLYNFLNISIPLEIQNDPNLVFRGLSATALFESFPPKFVLTIFKLLLLEYKVLFFGTNPGLLTQIILAFLTLLPKFLEYDIRRYGLSSEFSQDQLFQLNGIPSTDKKEATQNGGPDIETNVGSSIFYDDTKMANGEGPNKADDGTEKKNSFKSYLHSLESTKVQSADLSVPRSSFYVSQVETENCDHLTSHYQSSSIFDQYGFPTAHYHVAEWFRDKTNQEVDDGKTCEMSFYCPYLSLPYLDLIKEKSLDGSRISNCIVGASNVLFKQKANNIFDVIVDIDSHRMDFVDKIVASPVPDERKWRRDLSLTSADSRFVQYIVRRIRLLTPPPQKVDPPPPNETKTLEVTEFNEKKAECSRKEASSGGVTGVGTFDQNGANVENVEEKHEPLTNILPGESVYTSKPIADESSLLETMVTPSGSSLASTPESLKGFADEDDGQNDDLDAWIRGQFKLYLISLLSTTRMSDSLYRPRYEEDFNPFFVDAFKKTRIYSLWNSRPLYPGISEVQAGHPFQGALGIVDVKLRFSSAIANTDRGKKMLDEAALNAGKGLGFVWSSTKSAWSTLFKSSNRLEL